MILIQKNTLQVARAQAHREKWTPDMIDRTRTQKKEDAQSQREAKGQTYDEAMHTSMSIKQWPQPLVAYGNARRDHSYDGHRLTDE
jgi:hypothetical protein